MSDDKKPEAPKQKVQTFRATVGAVSAPKPAEKPNKEKDHRAG